MPEGMGYTPQDAQIGEHPMSSFNLNAHGENPDWEHPDAPDLSPSPELTAELTDHLRMVHPETGQAYSYIELNRHIQDSPPVVCFTSYSVDTSHDQTRYESEQLAIQSGRRLLVFDNP